jgi:hypothetical protein
MLAWSSLSKSKQRSARNSARVETFSMSPPTESVEDNFADCMPLPDKYKCEWTHTDKEILPSLEFMWRRWTPNKEASFVHHIGYCCIHERSCSLEKVCKYKSRYFDYIPDPPCGNGSADVEKVDYVEYDGPVCCQAVRKHSCGKNNMTWSEVLGAKKRKGLHPFLKLKVKKALLANPSLRPRERYRQLLNEHQDKDREDLFPIGQIGVVENQIVDCFNYERSKLLGIKHGEAINMEICAR